MLRRARLIALILICVACGGGAGDSSTTPPSADSATAPPTTTAPSNPVALECEEKGYPCSLDQVPSEILVRSDDLANEVMAMFADGRDVLAAMERLATEVDVVEIEGNEDAVRFRVEGGRGTWAVRASALPTRGGGGPSAARSRLDVSRLPTFRVVGEQRDEGKRALVLSPYEWQFGSPVDFDEGREVAAILDATRGYEGQVDFFGNPFPDSTEVGVASFSGWREYDVVHLSTHGTAICRDGTCRGAVGAGRIAGIEPGGGVEVFDHVKKEFKKPGLELAKVERSTRGIALAGPADDEVWVTSDFFRAEYAGGLNNTFVFFNACRLVTIEAIDLIEAVKGTTSVVLGSSRNVFSDAAYAAALEIYADMAERGFAAADAVERLGILARDTGSGAELTNHGRDDGGDLRIRDVVYVRDPVSGAVLRDGDMVSIEGSIDDGFPDSIPFSVTVDGVDEEFENETMVHLSVDGSEIFSDSVASGEPGEPGQWKVSGSAPLGFAVEEGMEVTVRAWVDLVDDTGESDHDAYVELTGERAPIMGWTWEMDFRQTKGHREIGTAFVTAGTMRFEFDRSQSPSDPIRRYRAVGGILTIEEIDQTDTSNCTYTAPEISYELTPDLIRVDVIALPPEFNPSGKEFAWNHLYFDTTADPITYWGNILTHPGAPDVHITDCPLSGANEVDVTSDILWFSIPPRAPLPIIAPDLIEASNGSEQAGMQIGNGRSGAPGSRPLHPRKRP